MVVVPFSDFLRPDLTCIMLIFTKRTRDNEMLKSITAALLSFVLMSPTLPQQIEVVCDMWYLTSSKVRTHRVFPILYTDISLRDRLLNEVNSITGHRHHGTLVRYYARVLDDGDLRISTTTPVPSFEDAQRTYDSICSLVRAVSAANPPPPQGDAQSTTGPWTGDKSKSIVKPEPGTKAESDS